MKKETVCKKEADVKDVVKAVLHSYGDKIWWFMPVPTGYGVQGVPDFIVCLHGMFIAIETKFGSRGLTPNQVKQINKIDAAGGYHMVINEDTMYSLKSTLDAWIAMKDV